MLHDPDYPIFLDNFYNDLLMTWNKIHSYKPNDAEAICRQEIWFNKYITSNRKSLKYKNWQDKNIKFVQDLVQNNG
jgi:hypothetical protein